LGGVFGLLAVVVVIPAYLVGYPDMPGSPEEATSYFEAGLDAFVFFNGVLPLFHVFFFVLFVGVLYGVLRRAEDGVQGGRGRTPGCSAGGGNRVRGALGGRGRSGDPLPSERAALRALRPGRSVRAGGIDALLVAVPFLPSGGVGSDTR
jgi:hypothetical protein